MNKYQELAGCDTREEYLDMLAEEYGMDYEIVSEIALYQARMKTLTDWLCFAKTTVAIKR